ncbi:MAG TPA: VOC family protein [Candidatus Peribacteria bacterium]|nr:VOC family protein [Candidatus Peribacteria bacterium]
MSPSNPVVHFEMPARDRERMKQFYAKAFGWKLNQLGPDMGDYVVAHTGETDPKTGMVKNPGNINGGFYGRTDEKQAPSVVIAVEDVKKHLEIVKKAGGTVESEPMEIPGIGWHASFFDTEGNRVSMLQPMRPM